MAYTSNLLDALADSYFESDTNAYLRACADAQIRAHFSHFDQHVVRSMHGHYWVADEADFEIELDDLRQDIVLTLQADRKCEN